MDIFSAGVLVKLLFMYFVMAIIFFINIFVRNNMVIYESEF